ncbi:MAG: hypothetical protein NE334_12115 [Lentisphaeraceae bacterium]|nr:hypothetical protein [Lentisphaeraceae bacterium]
MMILVIVMTIAVVSSDESPATVRFEVQDELKMVFVNAAIRAQAFNNDVLLSIIPKDDGTFYCTLKSKDNQSALETLNPEDAELEQMNREGSVIAWSGGDEYDSFGNNAFVSDYDDFLTEEGSIPFYFYPDGEATGPVITLKILEQEYSLTVGRLNGQLQLTEVEY